MTWDLKAALAGSAEIAELLADGWEPFAAVGQPPPPTAPTWNALYLYFKRRVDKPTSSPTHLWTCPDHGQKWAHMVPCCRKAVRAAFVQPTDVGATE